MLQLACALILQNQSNEPSMQWVSDLMSSNSAIVVLRKAQQPLKPVPAQRNDPNKNKGQSSISYGNPTIFSIDFWPAVDACRQSSALLEERKFDEAYAFITSFREVRADLHRWLDRDVIDCALLAGRADEAYREAVSFVKYWDSFDNGEYLQLALASAARGQVYPGQDDYCLYWLRKNYCEGWPLDLKPIMQHPRKSMILAAMALASSRAKWQPYYEYVLKLDPTNNLVGHSLVKHTQNQGRYADLRRIANAMLKNVKDEESQAFYRRKIDEVQGLPDRPKPSQTGSTIDPP